MISLCQLPVHFIDVSHYALKWNVVKMVNGGDHFYPCSWRFHQHSRVIPVCLPVSTSPALCAAAPHSPALATAAPCALLTRHQGGRRSAGWHSPWVHSGGHPGSLAPHGDLAVLPRSRGSFWWNRAFLEVFVAQPAVIKASMFSKGNEYFAGYCKEEFRNLGG